MQATDKFQGMCLQNADGKDFMGRFDLMPPKARSRLSNSPFNICAACVYEEAYNQSDDGRPTERHYLEAIDQIEAQIKAEE